ncbi:MAG TPA: L,D-transpeptidase family protein [Anaerolineales bacterium]|nr:L,D-transpeptidase family protein [Anaerolineales bacterium]
MINDKPSISRRDFLKLAALGAGSLAFRPLTKMVLPEFPKTDYLGRITVGKMDVYARPDSNSQIVGALYEDSVVSWNREVVGSMSGRINQRFVETPNGYVWGGYVQPVQNRINSAVTSLPQTSLGEGMWVEVTIPYVDLILENPPARAPWLQYQLSINIPPRFYYSQVVWVDQIRADESGQIWYRLNEKYGSGDVFWGPVEAFRPLTVDEVSPISPTVEPAQKRIVVKIWEQTLSCYEGDTEVHFAKISSGALFDAWGNRVDEWQTPIGTSPIWRKAISLPLSGGSASAGWSLPAVGWVSLFVGTGVAIHSTFWHNNYGEPSSRGCVNASPEDAKWIFRWCMPQVPYDPGDVTVDWPGGTSVNVEDQTL